MGKNVVSRFISGRKTQKRGISIGFKCLETIHTVCQTSANHSLCRKIEYVISSINYE